MPILDAAPLRELHPRIDVRRKLEVGDSTTSPAFSGSENAARLIPKLVFVASAISVASAPISDAISSRPRASVPNCSSCEMRVRIRRAAGSTRRARDRARAAAVRWTRC